MIKNNLEAELEKPIILEYAKVGKPRKRWYNPMRYKGAMLGLGYGLVWPATVLAYVSGFGRLYDKFLPHESFQDNFVYYAFKIPSSFVVDSIGNLTRDTHMDNNFVLVSAYLVSWALSGHVVEKTISFAKRKILKRK